MPIRHGGILANRASTWPRDHFWRKYDRAALIKANNVEMSFLPIVDADHGDRKCLGLRHGVPCL